MAKPGFRYKHYDLGLLREGTILEVTLSAINNVRLMSGINFQRFTETLDYKYMGGAARKSPFRIAVPQSAHWHLIVDMEGHNGLADSSVRLMQAPQTGGKPAP